MSASLLFLWSSMFTFFVYNTGLCTNHSYSYFLFGKFQQLLLRSSIGDTKEKDIFFLKLFYIYILKLRNPPPFFSYFEINLLDKMTTTGSALLLLNQLLNLTVSTPPPSVFPPSSSTSLSTTTATIFPTSTSTPFQPPTISSPSFTFSTQVDTRYLFGFLIIALIFLARIFLSFYRFMSRVLLLKTLKPHMSYLSSIHSILRTGTLEGKK